MFCRSDFTKRLFERKCNKIIKRYIDEWVTENSRK